MLVETLLKNNIFIIFACVFAICQTYLCVRYKPFQQNANKKCVKRFTANFYILLFVIVLSFTIDLVKCFMAFAKYFREIFKLKERRLSDSLIMILYL